MSKERVWNQFGYDVARPRNLEYDKLKGAHYTQCPDCLHFHELGSERCRQEQTKVDREKGNRRVYICGCNKQQTVDAVRNSH